MRSRQAYLIAAVLASASIAPAHAGKADEDPYARWITAAERVRDAGRAWLDAAPTLVERAGIYFQVQLRHALAASDRWLASVADRVAASFAIPDLTPLVVDPVRGIESSGFGWREDPIHRRKRFHKGADYRADRGTPVYAAGAGVVVFAGRASGYGKSIYIDHGGGVVTRYAHLRSIGVEEGDAVPADVQIGEVGSTGRTTGPHLHFEVRLDGRAVDPELALDIASMQRTEPPALVRLAALALLPDVQAQSVDAHDPPRGMKAERGDRKNRPERSGRRTSRRDRPTS